MKAPVKPAGWRQAWELNPPKPDDPDHDEYVSLLPAMIEYQDSLIAAAEEPPRLEPTPYFNGHELVQPVWEGTGATVIPPEVIRGLELDALGFPEPVDCGHLTLSALGDVQYFEDLIIPGRIHLVAAEEGTGKTYAAWELAIRMAVAGGSFAGTWPLEFHGPAVYLSEMHPDDDFRYQQDILESLAVERSALAGKLYRLDLGTAANGAPVLTDPDWRAWFTRWCRRRGVRMAVFDTGTGAAQVDPWGKGLQQVYRDLRVMLADHEELAAVLLLHLKKPTGKGQRRISDVLGEWGRWCDVLILMEADGDERTKLSTFKRIRHHKRIVATRSAGLLVDPQDITEKTGKKIKPKDQVATIEARPGLTYAELAEVWKVTKETVRNWVADLGEAVVLVPGQRGQVRIWAAGGGIGLGGDRQPPNDHQTRSFGGDLAVDLAVTANRQGPPIGKGALALGGRQAPDDLLDIPVEEDYPASAHDAELPMD